MAKPGWFLEKNGKFFGPFSPEKVRTYKHGEKITDDTLVARHKSGKGAKPLASVWEELDKEPEEAPTAPKKKAAPPQSPREWLVVSDNREFGPYDMNHLRELAAQGKLKSGDHVRKGKGDTIPIEEILPELAPAPEPAPPSAPAPPAAKAPEPIAKAAETKRPMPKPGHPKKPPERPNMEGREPRRPEPPKKRDNKRLWMGVAVMIGIGLIFGAAGWYMDKKEIALEDTKIGETLLESSTLHKMLRQAEMPPFSTLAQQALTTGLNFPSNSIRAYHASDLETKKQDLDDERRNKEEAVFWQRYFSPRVAQILRYQTNGQYIYTYLIGDDDLAFAVVIEGPSFPRQRLDNYQLDDFAPGTRKARDRANHEVWRAEIAPDILARAYWKKDKKGGELHFISVLNDPDLMRGG